MDFHRKQADEGQNERLIDQAADWFVRRDRGLNSEEEAEFRKAIQSNPALEKELEKFEHTQRLACSLPPEFARETLEDDAPRSWIRPWMAYAAIFTVLLGGIGLLSHKPWEAPKYELQETLQASQQTTTRLLPDGSIIRLNVDSETQVSYSNDMRQVRLLKGEAHFTVLKDPSRPFVVVVNQVQIQAVGTAFNVKRSEKIDVIVTEGTVKIVKAKDWPDTVSKTDVNPSSPSGSLVSRGQRAEVAMPSAANSFAVEVFQSNDREMEQHLHWRRSLLTLEGENLVEIAENFERKTGYQLIIADPSIGELQIGGLFPSDDVHGFLRILKEGYGIPSHEKEPGVFILGEQKY